MGIVTNIFDALRRIGSPTQKSALKRLDEGVRGKEILGHERVQVRDSTGRTEVFVATVAPVPETVEILNEEEVRPLKENAQYGLTFLKAYGVDRGNDWTLGDLDQSFAAWQAAGDKTTYSDDYVMEVLGAMFGEYCIEHLDMRWIKLTDSYGPTLAIDGIAKKFRAFPFQSIVKRIRDSEQGFFEAIFRMLRQNSLDADIRSNDA